jgi:peptide/nickel transport system substrate-binding protein
MRIPRLVRRKTRLSPLAILFSFALLATSLAPIARVSAQDTPVQGGTLRLAISEEPDQLDPARTIELLAAIINNNIYDNLVYIGSDGLPHPWVAESWEISQDNLTITMKIRQGIKFHDGTTLDAPAVKFGYDRILDPAMASPYLSFLGSMTSVDAPDATTLVFHFSSPYAPFFTNSATIPIVSPAGVEKYGDDFGHNPVGSGPFMFKSWETGSSITLVRNPDYVNYREDDTNKGAAYVDEIVYNVISEAATQTAAFESGELDILSVPREDVARLSEEPGVTIVSLEKSHNVNFIEFANKPPFNNPAFRKAVSYSIDRDSIAQIAYLGNATPNQCPMPIGDAAYDAELCAQHGYTYDLDKARAALAEGGFTDSDGNGIVEMDGKDLAVTLWSYAPYPVQAKTIEIIQADLNKIGLKCDIQTIEFGAMQPMLESGEIGMDYMRWTFSDQSILSALFKSPGWVKQTSDPELDKLIEVADTTVDPEKRLDASHAVMAYVLDNAIIAPVNSDWIQSAVHDDVHNYHWDAQANERLIDVWLTT